MVKQIALLKAKASIYQPRALRVFNPFRAVRGAIALTT